LAAWRSANEATLDTLATDEVRREASEVNWSRTCVGKAVSGALDEQREPTHLERVHLGGYERAVQGGGAREAVLRSQRLTFLAAPRTETELAMVNASVCISM